MKVRQIVLKMYKAILKHDQKKEKKLWFKVLRKSLKHKKTQVVR
jgi:hypothetical protein